MNEDVPYTEAVDTSAGLSDRLHWDWRNPLIAIPLTAIGVLLLSALVMVANLLGA